MVIPRMPHTKSEFQPDKNYELYSWNFRTINNLLHRAGFRIIENEYVYRTMMKKLLVFNKISFGLYSFFVTLFGRILDAKEIKVIAVKD